MFKPTTFKRVVFFLILDIFLSLLTLVLSYNLRFNFYIEPKYVESFFLIFFTLTSLKLFFINFFRLYNVAWRLFSLYEAKKLFFAHIFAYGSFVVVFYLFQDVFNPFPRSVIIIDMFLSMLFIGLLRVSKRLILESGGNNADMKKTLIIGANSMTQTFLKDSNNYYVTQIVDDADMVVGSYIADIHVEHINNLESIIKTNNIETVIITKNLGLEEIQQRVNKAGVKEIKVLSMTDKKIDLKDLSVEDLLARNPKDLDKEKIESFIKNRVVLVTGAGGSIGSEIVRQCVKYGAKKLIALDSSEYNLYTICEEVTTAIPVMQNVLNTELLEKTFELYKPDIVIHAAAYKHVPLVEANVSEAILNNIVGTKNVIDTAIKYGVKKFVLISTDKAVRPTNVMGATKRVCELYAQNSNYSDTEIVAVRFGNVLGSSGSVIPKFKKQIENGQNITVTHPEITRYFMLIPEACELVLQAGAIGKGGEIFILDMGESVKIVDLAKKMIELSGRDDINIEFTGLRPGEKLYEELLLDQSNADTQYNSITIAKPTSYDIEKLNKEIAELSSMDEKLELLKKMVPEFDHMVH